MAGPRVKLAAALGEADARNRSPGVADVAGDPPAVAARARAPRPDFAGSVVGKAVNEVAGRGLQRLSHCAVRLDPFKARLSF